MSDINMPEDLPAPLPSPTEVVQPPETPLPPLPLNSRRTLLTSVLAARFELLEAYVCAEHKAILQIAVEPHTEISSSDPGEPDVRCQAPRILRTGSMESAISIGDTLVLPNPSAHGHANGVRLRPRANTLDSRPSIRFDDHQDEEAEGDSNSFDNVLPNTDTESRKAPVLRPTRGGSQELMPDAKGRPLVRVSKSLQWQGSVDEGSQSSVRQGRSSSRSALEDDEGPPFVATRTGGSLAAPIGQTGSFTSERSSFRPNRKASVVNRTMSEKLQLQRSFTKETGTRYMLSPVWEALVNESARPSNFARKSATKNLEDKNYLRGATFDPDSESEIQDLGRKDWWVIQPNAFKRIMWDFMGMILIIYDLIFIPFQFFESQETMYEKVMNWVTRLFWTLDMPASSITGFFRPDGSSEMRFSELMRRYLRSWFLLDVLVNGSDWTGVFFGGSADGGDGVKTVRVIRILRMVRLLRLLRMPDIFNALAEHAGAAEFVLTCDLMKITGIFLAVTHLIACCWYAIGVQTLSGNVNWVQEQLETADAAKDLEYRYLTSLHWSVTQFIGSMEVRPHNWMERLFACCVLVFAFVLSASFVSSITSAMTRHHISATRQTNQLSSLRRYLNQNKISQRLLLKITRNAQFAMAEQQRNMPECDVELLQLVSDPLLMELHTELYSPSMVEHPFFGLYADQKPEGLRKICHAALSMQTVSMGDICFNVGEGASSDDKMMFVINGSLNYKQQDTQKIISEGSFLCEGVMWTAVWTHQGTLRASTDCKFYSICAQVFQEISIQFEVDDDFSVGPYAMAFVDWVNGPEVELSDVGNREVCQQLVQETYLEDDAEAKNSDSTHRTGSSARHSHGRQSKGSNRPSLQRLTAGSNNTSVRSSVNLFNTIESGKSSSGILKSSSRPKKGTSAWSWSEASTHHISWLGRISPKNKSPTGVKSILKSIVHFGPSGHRSSKTGTNVLRFSR